MMKMKKKICVLLVAALLCAGSLMGCESSGVSPSDLSATATQAAIHRFGMDDLTVNGKLCLGMTPDEVKEVLGQPDSENIFNAGEFIYGTHIVMQYDTLNLTFYDIDDGTDYRLGTAWSNDAEDSFAGDVHAGMTLDELTACFAQDDEYQPLYFLGEEQPSGEYLYGGYNRNELMEVKPRGTLEYAYINRWGDNSEYMVEYYYGHPLVWSEDDTAYSGSIYSLVCYMDRETDVVNSVSLSYDSLM